MHGVCGFEQIKKDPHTGEMALAGSSDKHLPSPDSGFLKRVVRP